MLLSLKITFYPFCFFLSAVSFSTAAPSLTLASRAPSANAETTINKAVDDPSYTDKRIFQTVMIDTHNKWRREHGAKSVSWDTKLAEFAEKHTKECEWGHSGGPYGENLSAGYKTAQLSLDAWGEERKLYKSLADYDKAVPPSGTGHFTQMVWDATDKIGCAATKCAGIIADGFESWFVACEYTARGNVRGAYTKNVHKPVRKAQ